MAHRQSGFYEVKGRFARAEASARGLHRAPIMCRRFAFRFASSLAAVSFLLAGCSSSGANAPASDGTQEAAPTPAPVHPGESDQSKQQPKDATTALVVGVDAENFQSQGFMIGQVEIVAKVDGLVAATETLLASAGALFPHELKLNPPKDKPEALVEIEVIARERADASIPPVVTRRATTHFVKGSTKLAYVFLEIRCNTFPLLGGGGPSGPTCAAPTTCVAGTCVPAELPVLDDYRADWPANPPSACGTGAPELTVGQGETSLAPLAENETVTLEEGGQCGHHLWFSLRMKNLAQSGTITTLSATQPGSAITVPATAYPYAWGPSGGGACDLVGVRFQVDASGAPVSDFLGKPLDVKVELKDKAGHTATVTRRVNVAAEMKGIPGRCGPGGING